MQDSEFTKEQIDAMMEYIPGADAGEYEIDGFLNSLKNNASYYAEECGVAEEDVQALYETALEALEKIEAAG